MRAKANNEKDHRRHIRVFKIFSPLMRLFMKSKFNYVYDSIPKSVGPYLLLCNHNTNFDPILLGLAAGQQIYFVASEHIMRKGLGTWFLKRYFDPIIHLKGKAGLNTIANMLKSLKAGFNVMIFPEGNRSFNGLTCEYQASIGKLARKSGATLVTYRLEGGYLSQPRWGFTTRKGKLNGRLVHIYGAEELNGMTDDAINEAIVSDLYEDAYKTEKREKTEFKGRRLCYGLESTIFTCPRCKKIGTLKSSDTTLSCECGYSAVYNTYGELVESDGTSMTVTELDNVQQTELEAKVLDMLKNKSQEPLFSDEITAEAIGENHEVTRVLSGTVTAYADRAEFNGAVISPMDLSGMAIHSRNTIVAHTAKDGIQYEIKGKKECFSALKYLYLYNILNKNFVDK